jgi:predicted dienelactone hydrolase
VSLAAPTHPDQGVMIVRVPLTFRQRGGRRRIIAPAGDDGRTAPRAERDNTLIRALGRAHRWKRRLEEGGHATVAELAAAERVNQSYLCRMLRLTLLAPDLVEAILDGEATISVTLKDLLAPLPVDWEAQRELLRRS